MNEQPTKESISHAGLSAEEVAALEESDAEGTGEETTKAAAPDETTGGSSAKAEPAKDVLPQTADDGAAGAAPDPKAEAKPTAEDATPAETKAAPDPEVQASEKPAAEAAADATPAADAAPAEEAAADETPATPAPQTVDSFRAQLAARGLPENYEQELTDTNASIEALDAKLAEGEIEYAQHAKENRELTTKLADLTSIKREAEFVAGNNELIADQHWMWEVERFAEENTQFQNPVIYGALRGALEELYAAEDNAGKSYRWFLLEASKSVSEAFSIAAPKADKDTDPAPAADTAAAEIKAEIDGKPQDPPPQTLANIPASTAEPESKDEFAALDAMEGMDLEAALAKLPKVEVDKYLDSRNY